MAYRVKPPRTSVGLRPRLKSRDGRRSRRPLPLPREAEGLERVRFPQDDLHTDDRRSAEREEDEQRLFALDAARRSGAALHGSGQDGVTDDVELLRVEGDALPLLEKAAHVRGEVT